MSQPTIWHNARCSKSRQTLQLLKDNGFDPEIIDYISDTPTKAKITNVLELLGIEAVQLMRTGDARFKEAGLSKTDPSDVLIDAMISQPILIERPVVLHNGKASIGRPPESVLDIL
ncbi:arsenate reductase (glutaredoxin) [Amylibacter sp. SFDW26]|uniref:arsenate reductase (glutaredoxin) n=1 Tax=Amylibacter sp. SFDW26 TaxID=2652722 RepID=UPI0012617E21|nr:arsenate reductase (glutaredoxin) [Amylibacter sp. SFDW26]KAB7613662.1 arsenate reductase (glutaredoxin) [Amylibacter sp. SFDW26]